MKRMMLIMILIAIIILILDEGVPSRLKISSNRFENNILNSVSWQESEFEDISIASEKRESKKTPCSQ
jgi:hypothetical protein